MSLSMIWHGFRDGVVGSTLWLLGGVVMTFLDMLFDALKMTRLQGRIADAIDSLYPSKFPLVWQGFGVAIWAQFIMALFLYGLLAMSGKDVSQEFY